MRVTHLSLTDYRNYQSAEVALSAGPNLFVGRNGQGKTNLVEAIGYFAILGSHRVSNDAALIRAGAESAVVRMRVMVGAREALLEIELNRGAPNRARVNRNAVRPRELTRWFSSVLFAPEDLMIVRGEPSVRRRFLDEAVTARNPAMSKVLSDYERVVRQRTSLLKSARSAGGRLASTNASDAHRALDATLSVWDEQLVALGSRIMHERRLLVGQLTPQLNTSYSALITQDHSPGMRLHESVYTQGADVSRETLPSSSGTIERLSQGLHVSRETIEHDFRAAIDRVRGQELERAVTLLGPHRDDLELELNQLPVKGFASHGESWSFALAIKLALAALLREESPAGDPVIILDDVFAELDAGRRERLLTEVERYEQVIVTAAVAEDVPQADAWHTHRVHSGPEGGTVIEVAHDEEPVDVVENHD